MEMSKAGFLTFPKDKIKKPTKISFANILGLLFQIDF